MVFTAWPACWPHSPSLGQKQAGRRGEARGSLGRGQAGWTGLGFGPHRSCPKPAGPAAHGVWPWTRGSPAYLRRARASKASNPIPQRESILWSRSKAQSLSILQFLTRHGPRPPHSHCGGRAGGVFNSAAQQKHPTRQEVPGTPGAAEFESENSRPGAGGWSRWSGEHLACAREGFSPPPHPTVSGIPTA